MLLQVDGSRHDWLECRGPYLTLIGGIDDATGLVPWARGRSLHDVFCFKYQRLIANDNTVRLGAVVMDIPPNRQRISYARCRVDLHQRFNGTLHVYHHGIHLTAVSPPPDRLARTAGSRLSPVRSHYQALPTPLPASTPPPPLLRPLTRRSLQLITPGDARPARITEPSAGQSH